MKLRSRSQTPTLVHPEGVPTLRAWVDAQPRTVTQGEMAKYLGITGSFLSELIADEPRACGKETALRIHRLTGVPLVALLYPTEALAS